MTVKLSSSTLSEVSRTASVPAYDPGTLKPGIVHFGVGNFHRAHQAVYLDDLFNLGGDHDWALIGAGVRPTDEDMRQKLLAQNLLTTVVEQEADQSTARVTASTLADMYAAVTSACGTLKGPLHGGANEESMKMLDEIKTPDRAEKWMMEALAEKKKIMGFGHRVYKKGDSRVPIMREIGRDLGKRVGKEQWVPICENLEATMEREKHLCANVDLYAAPVFTMFGFDPALNTPIFAASRVAADPPVTGTADAKFAPFDKLMTGFLDDHKVPGAALAVGRHGKLVYARGFGYADADRTVKVEPGALFRIAAGGQFALAHGSAREQKAADVDAGDQQHHADDEHQQ